MLALGCDHGGYELMQEVKKHLENRGIAYHDFGCSSTESVITRSTAKKWQRLLQEENLRKES